MQKIPKTKKEAKEKLKSPPKFFLEIEGDLGLRCSLAGAVGVRELCDNKIGILLKNGAIDIEGNPLNLSVYDNNCLEIKGNITNISIKYKTKGAAKRYED